MDFLSLFPSTARIVGKISYEQYQALLYFSAFLVAFLTIIIVYIVKSKNVRLPLLTEVGLFFIVIGLMSVSENMLNVYGGDSMGVAVRWIFFSTGFILIIISGLMSYLRISSKLGKKGERKSDRMPLYSEFDQQMKETE